MAITLQDLRIVNAVAKTGNLSKAAASLGLTQPALSWAVKKLETELDLVLFHRSKKGVLPTRSGKKFLAKTHALATAWEDLKHNLHQDESLPRGRFSFGIHSTLAAYTLPKFAPHLLAAYPQIELKLHHDLSRHISEGVINHSYDYGIVVNPPQHLDLTMKELYEDRVQFWIGEGDSHLQQPAHEDALWICNPDMFQSERLLQKISVQNRWKTRRVMYTTDLLVIAAMVAAGGGIGLLPSSFATSHSGGKLRPLNHSPFEKDTICLIWRGEAQGSSASKILRKIILDAFQAI